MVDFFAHTAGGTRPAGAPAVSSSTGALAAGERYLTAATGFLGSSFRLAAYRDGFATDVTKPQLRAIHASPDAPRVDIGVAATPSRIDPVLFGDLAFGDSSPEGGFAANAGHIPVGVAPAGQDATRVARLTVPAADSQRAFVLAAGALDPSKGMGFRFAVVDTNQWPWTVTHVFPQ
jgi:hypothetical protein